MQIKTVTFFLVLLFGCALSAGADEKRTPTLFQIDRWIADLTHPDMARREAATEQLIDAGPRAGHRIRPLCASIDQGESVRALRIFTAVFGVSPEIYDEVRLVVKQSRSTDAAPAARKIIDAGPGAARFALRLLAPSGGTPPELYTELFVRIALEKIALGADLEQQSFSSVLDLSTAAAPALLHVVEEKDNNRIVRTNALWLFSLVTGADRAAGLARILRDSDPVVRHEATIAAAETLTEDNFALLAAAIGSHPGAERNALANAAASRINLDDLKNHLRSNDDGVASMAAMSLGFKRDDDALEALTDRAKGEKRNCVLEAITVGLAEFHDPKGVEALVEVYTSHKDAAVRSSAIGALRHQTKQRAARACLTAALLDNDQGVRLQAAEALVCVGERIVAPALVFAANNDQSRTVRARALTGLATLVADGPHTARSTSYDPKEQLARSWERWLGREADSFDEELLPWFEGGRDAVRIFTRVRDEVSASFFYFDRKELVEEDALNKAALGALEKVFEGDDPVKMEGLDRQIFERLLKSEAVKNPEVFLSCLGAIPFESDVSDLVRITNQAVSGMIKSLGDRFSRLVLSNDPDGKVKPGWLPGLLDNSDKTNGLYVSKKDEVYVVDFVLYDSSAFYAGIEPGDQLIKVGDTFAGELTKIEIGKKIIEEGEFQFLREGWNRPYSFHLVPTEAMADHIVTSTVLPGRIGYLRLKAFDMGCSVKVEQNLQKLESAGIKGLIFDVRNNPGGTVIDATAIVDKFLPEGETISINVTRGRGKKSHDEVEEEVLSTDAPSDREYPVVILVNKSSASASELTSGSLQGNGRAIVVGQTSFGKGIGQSGSSIAGFASETALGDTRSLYVVYLTMMRYLLPEGKRSIHHIGVEPDVPVLERSLKGSAFDKVMRAQGNKALTEYVGSLIEKDRTAAEALAVFDGNDTGRYPGFEKMYGKVKRWVSDAEACRIVRTELRKRLIEGAEDDLFEKLFYDIQEDRTLRAGIREIGREAKIDLSGVEEYKGLQNS